MNITARLSTTDTLRPLTNDEQQLGQRILTQNLKLKSGEKMVIITDDTLKDAAAVWFESGKTMGADVSLLVIGGMQRSGEEPSADVIEVCSQTDVSILQTSHSLTHTSAARACQQRGGRVASLPTVDYQMMMRTLNTDYEQIKQDGEKIKHLLEQGTEILITSEFGTNIKARIRQNHVINDCGIINIGEVGNLPAGEVFFSPLLETGIDGDWVINGSIADDIVDEPITLSIMNGYVHHFSGGKAAQRLQDKLHDIGKPAFSVAEIGIGTNPSTNPLGEIIEAEKAAGTAHLALGNSKHIGGMIDVPIHLDGVTLQPTITIDNTIIMKEGKIVI